MITYRNILETGGETQEKVRLWRNSPRVKAGMLDGADISPEQHRKWLDSLSKTPPGRIVRVAFQDGVPFGVLNLNNIDWDSKMCDWGFYIGEDAFVGKGLGRRFVYDGSEWGFTERGFHKLYSSVRSDNLKVLHMDMEGGSHVEGFLKDHALLASRERIGIYLIAQFQDEWFKNREKISSWAHIGDS